jgi:hypothetical protein
MPDEFVHELPIPMTLGPGVGSMAHLMEELWYVRASVSRETALGMVGPIVKTTEG